jgi:thiamine-phosphate pyrophosphorylase
MLGKLQYISQGITADEQLNNIQQALEAGCDWIQLRFKNASEIEVRKLAEKVKELTFKYSTTFIINDHAHIAKEISADGVHLGLTDLPILEARQILGNQKIIGGTANTLTDVLQRVQEGCDYIGLGPYRFTTTKDKLSPILGLQGFADIAKELATRNISIPIYAIGGIGVEDISSIVRVGIYGVAISGLITHHLDKKILVEQLNTLLYEPVNYSR